MPTSSTFCETSDDDLEYVSYDIRSVPNDELNRSARNEEDSDFYGFILPHRRPEPPSTPPDASLAVMHHKATNTSYDPHQSRLKPSSSRLSDIESVVSEDFLTDSRLSQPKKSSSATKSSSPPLHAMLSKPLSFNLVLTENQAPQNSRRLRPGIYLVQSEKVIVSNHAIRTLVHYHDVKYVAQFKVDLKIEYKTRSGLAIKNKSDYLNGN